MGSRPRVSKTRVYTVPPHVGEVGRRGRICTDMSLRPAEFKSAVYAVPPLREK